MEYVVPDLPMGITEFTPGEIYYSTSPGEYIFRYVDTSCAYDAWFISDPSGKSSNMKAHSSKGSKDNPWGKSKTRIATEQEKLWFLACYNQKKFVTYEEAILHSDTNNKIRVSYTTEDGEIETAVIDAPLENAHKLKGFKRINYHITL